MQLTRKMSWIVMAVSTLLTGAVVHAELSATDIMTRAEQRDIGKDEQSQITMTLVTKGGEKRVRKMKMLRLGKASSKKVLIHFLEPTDVRGVGFMVWRHKDKDDDRWLYLPSLKMVRRIAAADKRASFVGSDFVYEDIAGRDVDEDTHSLTGTEEVDAADCYVVKSVPKSAKSAEFSSKTSWVRKDSFVVVKETYLDKQGKKLKELTADDLGKVEGIWTARKQTVRNVQTGHYTVVTWDKVNYNTGLSDDDFTERQLRRGV
ncbi:MAG: outer membrane lipoprotein-sorting protein [Armatimonadetes bacterium]|nr:outer membrane lipoprotein-sorting protein [Armatimonadota bacterium]